MEPFPGDEMSFTTVQNWFQMDNRTGVVRLLKSSSSTEVRNVTFVIVAREHGKSLETRAPAHVIFHGLFSK